MLVVSLCTAGITTICICMPHSPFRMKTETSLLNIVTGRYLDPHMCETYFMWQDLQEVGSTVTFIVKVSSMKEKLHRMYLKFLNNMVMFSIFVPILMFRFCSFFREMVYHTLYATEIMLLSVSRLVVDQCYRPLL